MYSNNVYAKLCNHSRLKRIDDNFVRCYECGLSMISQKRPDTNKSRLDFSSENKLFLKNFERNFTNTIEQTDHETSDIPIYEYYSDRHGQNKIIINKVPVFNSNPHKYEIFVNDSQYYLTTEHVNKILRDTNSQRIK